MKLYRERKIIFGKEEGYIKEFDDNGNLIIFNKFTETTVYTYINNQLINEKTSYGVEEEWKEKEYNYNPFGYRISELKVEKTGEKTILLDTDIVLDANGNTISNKTSNYLKKETNLNEYEFLNNLIISNKKFAIIGNKKKLINKTEFKYDKKNRLILKKSNSKKVEFLYSKNQITENYYENNHLIERTTKVFDEYGNLIKLNEDRVFSYIKEYNHLLKKSFLVSIVEADISDSLLNVKSNILFEYKENPFDLTRTVFNQKK